VQTVKSGLVQGGAIDMHNQGRMIYWSDIALWTINRMSLVTGESEVNNLKLLMLEVKIKVFFKNSKS